MRTEAFAVVQTKDNVSGEEPHYMGIQIFHRLPQTMAQMENVV